MKYLVRYGFFNIDLKPEILTNFEIWGIKFVNKLFIKLMNFSRPESNFFSRTHFYLKIQIFTVRILKILKNKASGSILLILEFIKIMKSWNFREFSTFRLL